MQGGRSWEAVARAAPPACFNPNGPPQLAERRLRADPLSRGQLLDCPNETPGGGGNFLVSA